MKTTLIKTATLCTVLLNSTLVYGAESIEGKWRGVLDIQKNVSLAIGVNITKENDQMVLTLDSPNQGMFERKPTKSSIDGDKVTFEVDALQVTYKGSLVDGKLIGSFTQGRTFDLSLERLDNSDIKRLDFEGAYGGNLNISDTEKLPLVLQVAVLKDGYLAKLDSPAQNSYTIPVNEFAIDSKSMSFGSKLINATYQGEYKGESYQGKFSQGFEFDLELKKNFDPTEGKGASLIPDFGEQGGAVALIENNKIKQKFYKNHDASTQYEIGSITKTMTAYLMAEQFIDSTLSPDAKLSEYSKSAPDIRIVELATHMSGLPRLPDDLFDNADHADPYAHYSESDLIDSLSSVKLEPKEYVYSNYAFGVLGEWLAKNKKASFDTLIANTLFKPLSMTDSYVAMERSRSGKHLANGYDLKGKKVSHWHFRSIAGAGAVVSDLEDMTTYVQSMMQKYQSKDPVVKALLTPQFVASRDTEQALGWLISTDAKGKKFAWHGGQTGGFSAFVGFYLDGSKALVMLNNQSVDITRQAVDLLTGKTTLDS